MIIKKKSFELPSEKNIENSQTTLLVNVATECDTNYNSEQVATTYSHPQAVYVHSFPDECYIFDDVNTKSNPLYCEDNSFEGCIGDCVNCQRCVECTNACYNSCVRCDACQTCIDCQTGCQLRGFGYVGNLNSQGYMIPKSKTQLMQFCKEFTSMEIEIATTYQYKCDASCMECVSDYDTCSTCYTDIYTFTEKTRG